jgi:hypothetical protein
MKKAKELKSSNLKNSFNIDSLKFETTEEVEPFNGIIGQERALDAIKSAFATYCPFTNFVTFVVNEIISDTTGAFSFPNTVVVAVPLNNFSSVNV